MKAILFDLDGTLLPMDMEKFMHVYFHELGAVVIPMGVPADKFAAAIWAGTGAMMKNTGEKLNADVFWDVFTAQTGVERTLVEPVCDSFYDEGFHKARAATMENPLAAEAVRVAREKADKVVLATNPLFPMQGQKTRMSWLGLKEEDFDLVTCYSSDRHCKPNPAYFEDVCRRIGVEPKNCLMIGNDEREDMLCASSLGIECYLVTDCMIPCPDHPWQGKKGTFAEMVEMLKSL
ncbi:MAG: HAD family hydrolase [Clostridia bacterium]|nr:HAD family hydrolase [Clostridia bacterium]